MRSLIKKFVAVILKELRSQMRGGRAFALLGAYLLLLIGFEWTIAKVFLVNSENMGAESYKMGFMLFTMLSLFQLLLISFLTPSFTAGAISREKEQQTFDLLVVSEISPISVILGKLVSSLGYVFLLIITSIPVMSTVFLFGSVSPEDFLATFLILITTTITFGSIGIFFSSLIRKTQIATALTYGTIMFLLVATLIGGSLVTTYMQRQYLMFQPGPPPKAETLMDRKSYKVAKYLLRLSPVNAMTSITGMTPDVYGGYGDPYISNPYALLLIPMPQFQLESMVMQSKVQQGGMMQKEEKIERPDWHYTVSIYLSVSALLLLISSRLLLPYHRWRIIRIPFLKKKYRSPPEAAAQL
jgi:ABC-type transport system involved in multi-copper enzyme maturation permease subunit